MAAVEEEQVTFFFVTPAQNCSPIFQYDEEETELPMGTGSGRKRLFSKELRCMMFGFGDDQNPYTESVDLIEDLVIEFITEAVSIQSMDP
jgi:hypothetical protein